MGTQRAPTIYLTNKELRAALEKSLAQGRMTEELGKLFILLVDNIAKKSCYASYTYLDEMKGTAILTLCKGWYKFDLKYQNCFAYYTTFVNNAFNYVFKVEKKIQRGRDAIMVDNGLNPSNGFSEEDYESVRGFNVGEKSKSGADDWAQMYNGNDNIDGVPLPKYEETEKEKVEDNCEELVEK